MIVVSCRFAHSFKIMCIPQPAIPFVVPPHPVQALHSGRGVEIDVLYICCADSMLPEAFELWDFAEDGFCEVHPYARVKILDNFREDTFYSYFFNTRRIQIPFLGRRSVNMSAEWLDIPRADQHVGSCVTNWTENFFVHSWGPYPTMIPHTVFTIKRCAYYVPVNPHALAYRANHECLRLIRVERRQTLHGELLARTSQYMRDEVRAFLSDDSNDGWLEESDSD